MVFLAMGLPDLVLEPGLPIPGAQTQTTPIPPAVQTPPGERAAAAPWLLQGLLAVGLVLLLVVFLVALFKKASKKRIGITAAVVAVLVALFIGLPRVMPAPSNRPAEAPVLTAAPTAVYAIAPVGDPPAALFWLIAAGLLLAALVLGAWLLVMAYRQSHQEDLLAREAAAAVQAIAQGQEVHNVIIRCYLQMEQVIKTERGIERNSAITPREFERFLAARGIPNPPLRQLTRLFEIARYGSQASEPRIEQEAVECLTAIRAACQIGKRGAA